MHKITGLTCKELVGRIRVVGGPKLSRSVASLTNAPGSPLEREAGTDRYRLHGELFDVIDPQNLFTSYPCEVMR